LEEGLPKLKELKTFVEKRDEALIRVLEALQAEAKEKS
jgi:hypothetical protein